jgi:hypothetical protein
VKEYPGISKMIFAPERLISGLLVFPPGIGLFLFARLFAFLYRGIEITL